jgi:hypothetical protein
MRSTRIIAIAFAAAAAFFSLAVSARDSDAVLQSRLVGKWHETRVVDCETSRLVIVLKTDGSFEVKGAVEGCGRKFALTWRGKWTVRAGRFQYTTTFSDPPDEYPIGESFSDEIVTVSDAEWVMVEESTGNKSIAKRVTKE